MRLILLSLIILGSVLFASSDHSKKRVKLLGDIRDGVNKRVTVKQLEKIGLVRFVMIDPYLNKEVKYSGVTLNKLVSTYAHHSVTSLHITAIDGYNITFTKQEWENDTILLATRQNDKNFGYDKKGPLRIIYPNYDETLPKYHKNLIKWIWMIKTIEFK